MRIFHLTTPEAWDVAIRAGTYTLSTRGVTLETEGYIHCSSAEQVDGVRQRFYADLDDLLLLVVETDLLTSPWRVEQLDGAPEPYPHVYGPLNLDAIVETRPL